ncbi:unnamed protein product, partial [Porites lobata]
QLQSAEFTGAVVSIEFRIKSNEVILACLFAFEVNTLGLVFQGFQCSSVTGGYLEIKNCNGTSCSARISGRSCDPSKTSFNIINAPATGGTTRKCIQFTSNSVSYALKVIGTNPPTLQFMRFLDHRTKRKSAYYQQKQCSKPTNN